MHHNNAYGIPTVLFCPSRGKYRIHNNNAYEPPLISEAYASAITNYLTIVKQKVTG